MSNTTKSIDPERDTIPSGGRPKIEITKRDISQIEQFSSIGLTSKEIASMLGISRPTYQRWFRDPEVLSAISRGKAQGLALVGKALQDKALNGDTHAMVWYEKTRGKRTDRVEIVQQDDAEAITRLIGVMTPDQLQRVANGESPSEVLGRDA